MHAGTVEASTSLAATLLWMTVAVPVVSSIDDGVLTERSTAVVWLPEALYVRESDFFARLALSARTHCGFNVEPDWSRELWGIIAGEGRWCFMPGVDW